MYKNTEKAYYFIILIPHRDSGRLLDEYRSMLFSKGVYGAWSFPTAAPLAAVSKSFSRDELKGLAANIRSITIHNDGKIQTLSGKPDEGSAETAETAIFSRFSLFGPQLNLPIDEGVFPETAKAKITNIFSPPVLCAALISRCAAAPPRREEFGTMPPFLSFRAAAVANLAIRPLSATGAEQEYSFEWVIGPPVWLPGYKGKS